MNLIISILALSFVVFFHELGHFIFAKLFGVRVQTFSIGFGPKLLSYYYKGTQYSLSLIPLGGYVKLQGETNNTDLIKDSSSLFAKHPLERIAILFAGPLFNILLAFLLYICIFLHGIPTYSNEPIIGEVNPSLPSHGILLENDKILSINGVEVKSFQDISRILNSQQSKSNLDSANNIKGNELMQDKIALVVVSRQANNLQNIANSSDIDVEYLRLEVPISHSKNDNRLILGIAPKQELKNISLQESIIQSLNQTIKTSLLLYEGLKDLLIGVIGLENINSIIGITEVSIKALNVDFIFFLWVVAFISINLGIINLLPLPLLDGGQIVFTCYEWLTGKSISKKAESMIVSIGISIIVAIMCIGIYNDIYRLISSSI
ncbi:RIP metalloprotease RseP [Helicobacter muridarum]|uniref:Zinc metalloprotease n=1 Tax=Helicobacter muridarum TaxID=216 RepID=A0A099TX42_9HELI|nr:RIP metalloprotease RseP [Helicobacter muridarum]TLE01624.1 RIP metalloprotease RseP [Helicobacter muridarum]STQ86241.1 zinc metalloprotease [Helicobacter muridarum]